MRNGAMLKRYLPLLYLMVIVSILGYAMFTRPEPEIITPIADVPDFGMAFPDNYRETFIRYLVVDRIDDTVRHIYAHPDAIAAVEAGADLPYGTQIIIETWDAQRDVFGIARRDGAGHLIPATMRPNLHMMEKRANWTTDQLPSPVGVIDWNFASFDVNTMLPSIENRNDCLTCHDGGAFRRDFVFSRSIIEAFINADHVEQYFFCSLPNRGNCIR
ncbi:MAG: cytochrome P460 family protein [Phototrophicaceae bacterium]